MKCIAALSEIAKDLAGASDPDERSRRLLESLQEVLPLETAALLHLDRDDLVLTAALNLPPAALGRRYPLLVHPRLDAICKSTEPILLPQDSPLPDPFSGSVRAAFGCPLRLHGELLGALTAGVRDLAGVDPDFLRTVAALAAAGMRPPRAGDTLTADPLPLAGAVREFQRALVRRALAENGDSWAAAARALEMDRGNLHHLAARLGVGRAGRGRSSPRRRKGLPPPPDVLL